MTSTDPVEAARAAGLRYVNDDMPGIKRRRAGKGFSYRLSDGTPLHDPAELARITGLGIPPAWNDVWISPMPNSHIQATGRDVKGRKQYRYHPRWREIRDETKYDRMLAFGAALPQMRARIERDLQRSDLSREKVIAAVVRLLEMTLIRVGNAEYARANESYGLTTLHDEHVTVSGTTLHFHFRGKSGKEHAIAIQDRRLARIVKRCQDLPGYELFQYLDAHREHQTLDSGDVNAYLREISGQDFTAKDFRTWAGTVLAVQALAAIGPFSTQAQARRNVSQAIKQVAQQLGNTPAICRKSYVYPAVIETYLKGALLSALEQVADLPPQDGLRPEEAQVMAWMQQQAKTPLA